MSIELTSELAIAYSSLLGMALVPIYIGSHWSLKQKGQVETMSSKDAWMFPIIGSGVLFGLYMLFKLFSKDSINLLLTAYFLFFGLIALAATVNPVVEYILVFSKKKLFQFSVLASYWSKSKKGAAVTISDVISGAIAAALVGWYVMGKHWLANNILGLAFSIQGIAFLSVGSYKTGCTLLSGLFFYDIFWVFGTDVMVTVAKSFDAPIKLLFPKNIFAETFQFSMLGLGDIVIPGVFIALLLRFDAKKKTNGGGAAASRKFNKTYFHACFVGYFVGLATTMVVMHTFQAAQPALLYLVPACIGFSLVTAVINNDTTALWNYTEEVPEAKKKK